MSKLHDWVKSTYGHGEQMCRRCGVTNREAAVLNILNQCDSAEAELADASLKILEINNQE